MDRHGDDGHRSYRLYFCAGRCDAGAVLSHAWNWQTFVSADLLSAGGGGLLYAQPQAVSFAAVMLCTYFGDSV